MFFINDVLFGIYRVPLFYAVKRNDIQAIQLLLEFRADPNIICNNMSLVSHAAQCGFPEAIKLLVDHGANIWLNNSIPALLAVLQSGSKLCLSVLLENHRDYVLKPINNEILLVHALKEQSSLLPFIATITQEMNPQIIPPKGITSDHKSQLKKILALKQDLLPVSIVTNRLKEIKIPWKSINV